MRVLFTHTGGPGHLHPLLPLARGLRDRGHDIAFVGARSTEATIVRSGFATLPSPLYPEEAPDIAAFKARRTALTTMAEQEEFAIAHGFAGCYARHKAAHLLPLLDEWRPHLVVRDEVDWGACIAAEHAGIPHVAVFVLAAGGLARDDLIAPSLAELQREYDLPPDPDGRMPWRYLVLAPFPRSFRDPRFPLPPTSHYVRYLPDAAAAGLPAWVRDLPRRPTIYFSLGTEFNASDKHLFEPVIAGLREECVNLIVTVGRDLDPSIIGSQPPNVRVERYIPLSELAPQCDLIVTHGGTNTIMTALNGAVPMVVLPIGADQPHNAERCAALGVARVLDTARLTPDAVRKAALEVMQNGEFRAAAKRVQAEMHALPGLDEQVTLVERVVSA